MRTVSFIPNNDVTLLFCGGQFYPALLKAFEEATSEIYFETYIFADDSTGHIVRAGLLRAARRGVHVRVISDWFGTGRTVSPRLHETLMAGGVEHRMFNPWFRRGAARSHRKICVVDGRVAFVGGLNINDDDRCDYNHARVLPAPRWDMAVRITGPLVAQIQHEAEAQWARVGHLTLVSRLELYREMRYLKGPSVPAASGAWAAFVVRDNLRNRRTIQRAYLQAMGTARSRIVLATPYFAPGRKMRNALVSAAQRGVHVTLLIGVGEIGMQDAVAHSFYPRLLAGGVHIVEYRKTQLHGKVAVIDDEWSTVGSSNCDGLSLFVNQEANVVLRDAGFARALRERIEAALAEGEPVHADDFANIAWPRRVGFGISYFVYRSLMHIFTVGKYS